MVDVLKLFVFVWLLAISDATQLVFKTERGILYIPYTSPTSVRAPSGSGISGEAQVTGCSTQHFSYRNAIALIDRAPEEYQGRIMCSFATKVRTAQNAGAAAVVVYDSAESTRLLRMGDYGGDDIRIPVVFVSKRGGMAMVRYLSIGSPGYITIMTEEFYPDPFGFQRNESLLYPVVLMIVAILGLFICSPDPVAINDEAEQEQELMTDEEVEALPVITMNKKHLTEVESSCTICLCDYEIGEELKLLPCNHAFHTECVQPWLTGRNRICPNCKHDPKEPLPPSTSTSAFFSAVSAASAAVASVSADAMADVADVVSKISSGAGGTQGGGGAGDGMDGNWLDGGGGLRTPLLLGVNDEDDDLELQQEEEDMSIPRQRENSRQRQNSLTAMLTERLKQLWTAAPPPSPETPTQAAISLMDLQRDEESGVLENEDGLGGGDESEGEEAEGGHDGGGDNVGVVESYWGVDGPSDSSSGSSREGGDPAATSVDPVVLTLDAASGGDDEVEASLLRTVGKNGIVALEEHWGDGRGEADVDQLL